MNRTQAGLILFLLAFAGLAYATEIVYVPNNPSFGGSPLNGPVLLNSANAQNKHTDPAINRALSRLGAQSSLELFNQRLQSLILDRIATSITGTLFDVDGNLQPGTVDTSGFSITIVDQGGGVLLITTTDKTTGASTSFQISTAP
jgi:curli production assembly/transport component CsgF